jgi:hypothetical protein
MATFLLNTLSRPSATYKVDVYSFGYIAENESEFNPVTTGSAGFA